MKMKRTVLFRTPTSSENFSEKQKERHVLFRLAPQSDARTVRHKGRVCESADASAYCTAYGLVSEAPSYYQALQCAGLNPKRGKE